MQIYSTTRHGRRSSREDRRNRIRTAVCSGKPEWRTSQQLTPYSGEEVITGICESRRIWSSRDCPSRWVFS